MFVGTKYNYLWESLLASVFKIRWFQIHSDVAYSIKYIKSLKSENHLFHPPKKVHCMNFF